MTTSRTKKYGGFFLCMMIVFTGLFAMILYGMTPQYASGDMGSYLRGVVGPSIVLALAVSFFGTIFFACQEEG
ncbi:hypothetical protein EU546_03650 [Candidatus Thorarchaeota archaeon]|nr:MAG: hypothetical protein EU546_03650 [Candidatus Thorarchaeota archaeon]